MTPERATAVLDENIRELVEAKLKRLSDNPIELAEELVTKQLKIDPVSPGAVFSLEAVHDAAMKMTAYWDGETDVDPISAIVCLVKDGWVPGAVAIKDYRREVRRLFRRLNAVVSGSDTIEKGPPSRTFPLGTASHRMHEAIALSEGDFSLLSDNEIELIIDEGEVVGYKVKKPAEVREPVQLFLSTRPPELSQEDQVQISDSSFGSDEGLTVSFECPLPARQDDQSIEDWAVGILDQSVRTLREEVDVLPSKPHDIERVIKNGTARIALMQALEAVHILFSDENMVGDMSLVKRGSGGVGRIGIVTVEEIRALNWFSLIRKVLEKREEGRVINRGVVKELALGRVRLVDSGEEGEVLAIPGGIVDLVYSRLRLKGEAGVEQANYDFNMALVTRNAEGEYGSQKTVNRRMAIDPNTGQKKEVRTRLGRNFRSYLVVLVRKYGLEAVLNDLEIALVDLKFQGGDGGWAEVLSLDDHVDPSHLKQMSEYLLFVAAQFLWIEKWTNGEGENFAINAEELTEFIIRRNLWDRLKGSLAYQFAEGEKSYEVMMFSERDKLGPWIEEVLKGRFELAKHGIEVSVMRALERLVKHQLEDITEVTRGREPIVAPEGLEGIIVESKGRPALVIDQLAGLIEKVAPKERKGAWIDGAVTFTDDEVFVIWMSGVVEGTEALRIAVESNGKFCIRGVKDGIIRGQIISSREMVDVRERRGEAFSSFERLIWSRLEDFGIHHTSVDTAVGEDLCVMSGGSFRESVKGKPVVVSQDARTGIWSMDVKLLREVVDGCAKIERRGHHYGLNEIDQLLSDGFVGQKSVYCPQHHHRNTDTRAASFNRKSADEPPFIVCFGCHQTTQFHIEGLKRKKLSGRIVEGTNTEDYRGVSSNRDKELGTAHTIAEIMVGCDHTAEMYTQGRGVDFHNDLGRVGYIPPWFSEGLADLTTEKRVGEWVTRKGFTQLAKLDRDIRLDQLVSIIEIRDLEDSDGMIEIVERLLQGLESLPLTERERIFRKLDVRMISALRRRGVVGRNKEGLHRWGGRLLFPTIWPRNTKALRFGHANIIGRDIDGLAQGPTHYKLFTGKRKLVKRKELVGGEMMEVDCILEPTPVGFWCPDFGQLRLNVRDRAIFVEGQLNGVSIGRMCPELKHQYLAFMGTGYKQMIAMLRFMGVRNDPQRPDRTLGMNIGTAVLGYDFDLGGEDSYYQNELHLRRAFQGCLNVIPIHELLPPDVRQYVPSYTPGGKGGHFREEGMFYFDKTVTDPKGHLDLDLNDLLTSPMLAGRYSHNGVVRNPDREVWEVLNRYSRSR